ncbi:bifunctional metallophosphatase/5'-nucleotidase [Magnetospirillum molischianum]|uniref:5'-nucleotidase/2',3'-cyclic phosphodiesterase and related esterase n=1 Tax=Magnetospirillum molischianum DSM 120 TaxID=1150626 RepID=H8FRJ5_MAGML|nr:bifunctional UDP-sugar hydrolase/5'-nucleotidase [Magnetospirillum molischianum]CCG40983.1 5'-nucleotidase/2',3'-cyclic phosphodiesterase and related esterase [Magnetospirillum molischianum DSM 120]
MRAILGLILAGLLWSGSAAAEQVRLTFLHVNDIYEYHSSDGVGGLAELSTRLKQRRAEAPNPLFTFGGDLISPSLASNLTKGAHLIALFNRLEPVAAVPGNHEFDFGPAVFADRIGESRFPWIGSNVLGADGAPFGGMTASRIVESGGIKVGFLGILTARTGELSLTDGVVFSNETETARTTARRLRAQGAEIVVALTHLDIEQDRALALAVPEIDLILGGHDHDPIAIRESGALVLKAGQDAQWLGEVEMVVERPDPGQTGRTRVYPQGWRFEAVRDIAPDPALAPLISATDTLLSQALDQPLAVLDQPLDSRTGTVRGGEAAIGNLFADALRAHFEADAALINGGGLRGNRHYPTGATLSRRDVLTEMPFGNAVMLLELSGTQLRAALEHGLSGIETKAGRFPQVSGISVEYAPSRPVGQRIVSIFIGGMALQDDKTYRLATSDYLGHGGDGYSGLKQARVIVDASGGPLLANVVGDYLAANHRVMPRIDGRMKALR